MWRRANKQKTGKQFKGGSIAWRNIQKEFLNNQNYKVDYHRKANTPYAWNEEEKIFLGFENIDSLNQKANYVNMKNLGGIMIWSLDQDDDQDSLLNVFKNINLCKEHTDNKQIEYECLPIDEKRWWTPEDSPKENAGMCGKSGKNVFTIFSLKIYFNI
jgi:GH18 family chitinase